MTSMKTRGGGRQYRLHRPDHLAAHGPAKNSIDAVQKHAHADVTARQVGRSKVTIPPPWPPATYARMAHIKTYSTRLWTLAMPTSLLDVVDELIATTLPQMARIFFRSSRLAARTIFHDLVRYLSS